MNIRNYCKCGAGVVWCGVAGTFFCSVRAELPKFPKMMISKGPFIKYTSIEGKGVVWQKMILLNKLI